MSEKTRNSVMLAATASYIEKIETFANDLEINFTDYQKSCVANAIRTINPMLIKGGYTWQNFEVDNIITVLQQTAFLELNPSATPHECYYIVRKEKNKAGQWNPILEFNIEGNGNDRILLKFGQDVKEIKSYIVYEGDEFTEGYLEGWDMTLPTYRRKFLTNKPLKVVYLIKKTNDEIDVQYADTQDVMKSLLANAKQNMMNAIEVDENKLLREVAKLGLYEVLENDKWLDKTITKKGYQNKPNYQAPLFNPSYTSPISMYNMIERKLRNHATRKYPKNFNHKEVSTLYEDTFDEKYNEKGNLISAEERLAIANADIDKNAGKTPLVEKEVEPVVEPVVEVIKKVEKDDRKPLVVKEEPIEVIEKEPILKKEEEKLTKSLEKDVTETVEKIVDDLPDWMQ